MPAVNERELGDFDREIKSSKREALNALDKLLSDARSLQTRIGAADKTIAEVQPEVDGWQHSTEEKLKEIFATDGAAAFFKTDFLTYNQVHLYRELVVFRIEKLVQLRAVAASHKPVSYFDVWSDFVRDPRTPYQAVVWFLSALAGSGLVVLWIEKCHK